MYLRTVKCPYRRFEFGNRAYVGIALLLKMTYILPSVRVCVYT